MLGIDTRSRKRRVVSVMDGPRSQYLPPNTASVFYEMRWISPLAETSIMRWKVAAGGLALPGSNQTGGPMPDIPAKLALEDGTVYLGRSFGATGETFGE